MPVKRANLLVVAATAAVALATMPPAPAAAAQRAVESRAVTFSVQNVNRSKFACKVDGAAYQVKGHVVGPRSALAAATRKRSVTLYVHGLGFGEWFWRFEAVPGYDFSRLQARAGHTSVVIDRLGYDASGRPEGRNGTCLGGQADVVHQIVQQLRAGSYAVEGGKAVRFKRVALAGHSAGAEISNIAAYSFRDVDALVAMAFSYSNLPRAQIALGPTRELCVRGGEPSDPGGPSGYSFYGQPAAADFQSIMFANAAAPVVQAALPFRNRDPCGDVLSIIPALLQQGRMLKAVKVPVLVLCGRNDALYSPIACDQQLDRYTRSRDTSLALVAKAGHALTLQRSARSFRRKLSRWLARRGF